MAKRTKKLNEDGSVIIKPKGLFDHIKHLREVQDPKYFDTLTDADKKSWSNYMVCRFLSMQPELLELVNDVQVYTQLSPEKFYKICLLIVPLGRSFHPYVKGKKEKWKQELRTLLCQHFQESERNVRMYLEILKQEEICGIVMQYGYSEKDANNLLKQPKSSDEG